MRARLPLRLRSRAGEPPHGVLLRLAARHGDPDVRNFAADLGLSFSKVLAGHDADRLARLAGIDRCELARFTPDIDVRSRTVEIGGDRLLLNDWSVRARRWCPLCLREDRAMAVSLGQPMRLAAWHRALWDIRSVGSCPLHNVRLFDSCPACGTRQDLEGPSVDRCRCGMDLSRGSFSSGGIKLSSFIAGRLGLCPHKDQR